MSRMLDAMISSRRVRPDSFAKARLRDLIFAPFIRGRRAEPDQSIFAGFSLKKRLQKRIDAVNAAIFEVGNFTLCGYATAPRILSGTFRQERPEIAALFDIFGIVFFGGLRRQLNLREPGIVQLFVQRRKLDRFHLLPLCRNRGECFLRLRDGA